MLFVDDTVIFGSATLEQATRLRFILDQYCKLSGQAVNVAKLALLFSANTPHDIRLQVLTSLGVPDFLGLFKD
ncbi:hypothetical protein LINGRAHAP2_LOCUS2118 [Linum grandiflorum]